MIETNISSQGTNGRKCCAIVVELKSLRHELLGFGEPTNGDLRIDA